MIIRSVLLDDEPNSGNYSAVTAIENNDSAFEAANDTPFFEKRPGQSTPHPGDARESRLSRESLIRQEQQTNG